MHIQEGSRVFLGLGRALQNPHPRQGKSRQQAALRNPSVFNGTFELDPRGLQETMS